MQLYHKERGRAWGQGYVQGTSTALGIALVDTYNHLLSIASWC